MAWEARWGLKHTIKRSKQSAKRGLNGVGGPLEGRKYSGSRIRVFLAVFGEMPVLLLMPLFPAPLAPAIPFA